MIEAYLGELRAPFLPLAMGSTDAGVKRAQEWLCFQGFATGIDGDYGPATRAAVIAFQQARGCLRDHNEGTVDAETWGALSAPLANAEGLSGIVDGSFGEAVCRLARTHLAAKAREVGGDNRGPWVRHYCRGPSVAWCQGFASTLWCNAARRRQMVDLPIRLVDDQGALSLFVPWVVNQAKAARRFRAGRDPAPVPIGSFFFVPGGEYGYLHVGIVTSDDGTTISTIEGNTNHDGSANGYEVAARFRRKAACDYGLAS